MKIFFNLVIFSLTIILLTSAHGKLPKIDIDQKYYQMTDEKILKNMKIQIEIDRAIFNQVNMAIENTSKSKQELSYLVTRTYLDFLYSFRPKYFTITKQYFSLKMQLLTLDISLNAASKITDSDIKKILKMPRKSLIKKIIQGFKKAIEGILSRQAKGEQLETSNTLTQIIKKNDKSNYMIWLSIAGAIFLIVGLFLRSKSK